MSRVCRDCDQVNSDDRIFCSHCGAPLDPQVRLMMELEELKKNPRRSAYAEEVPEKEDDYDEDEVITPSYREPKKGHTGLIVLAVVVVVAVALFFLLGK